MPAGGGGMNDATVAWVRPGKLSGSQLAIPTVPPGRHTRNSSAAATSGRGAKIAPKHETTRSKVPPANGSASASASSHSTARPAVRTRPDSTIRGVRSDAVTIAPSRAAATAVPPVPAATSRTRSPARVPTAWTRPAAAGVAAVAIRLKSPWLQMNFWISLSAVTSMVVSMHRCSALRVPATTGSTRGSGFTSVPGMSDTPTIYEWGGGREAFERWMNVFYDLVEGEPDIVRLFGGTVSEEHRAHVTTWWCEVMGGPATYTSDHGGYEHMLAKHRGLAITPEQRLRFVTLLSQAADEAGLP